MQSEAALVATARSGSEDAFAQLVEPHRRDLLAHCYRILGSLRDAEDALQEALLRAWRALPRFAGRSAFATWLYRIATNACFDQLSANARRGLPGPRWGPSAPDAPAAEGTWLEPYPDRLLAVEGEDPEPAARYERRESVELAFVAALQHLPPRQRAALILRDVLGFTARETGAILDATPASVNSALQRARRTMDELAPEPSQQSARRALGDDRVRATVDRFLDAMDRADVDGVVRLLADDACWAMPPFPLYYRGRREIAAFLVDGPFRVRWRTLVTAANGQPALARYAWNPARGAYVAAVLDVLAIRGTSIAEVVAFVDPDAFTAERPTPAHAFERLGLPGELPALA